MRGGLGRLCHQAACGECPALQEASMLDGANPNTVCLSLERPLVLSSVTLCSGLLEGRDPYGGTAPVVPSSGKYAPPDGPYCLWPTGQTPRACWAGLQGGRTMGCRRGRRNRIWGIVAVPLAFLGTCVSWGCTWPEWACLSPAARGQSCPGCRRPQGSLRFPRCRSPAMPCVTSAVRC